MQARSENRSHQDHLDRLNLRTGLRDKVEAVHAALRQEFDFIDRVAVALYDERAQALRTFVHSSLGDRPLENYEAALAATPSLLELLETGRARVLNDLSALERPGQPHTRALRAMGYQASFTLPYYANGAFEAFVFFDARRPGVFTPPVLRSLEVYGRLVGGLVLAELLPLRTLLAATRTVGNMIHLRDPETGAHLERMAAYTRIIARDLAARGIHALSDEVIERLAGFAALHDLGKLAIPDQVLLKPIPLGPDERTLMRTHTTLGREMVDDLLRNFGLEGLEHADILRVVTERHHELLDGSGYPGGLRGEEIPVFARIVAVADVFDALTTRRPYKYAWPVADALEHLQRLAGEKLDPECVASLVARRAEVERVMHAFPEEAPV